MQQLTFSGFLIRFVLALALVFLTFNPTQYNFIVWLMDGAFEPLKGLAGIVLLIAWVIFMRASLRSLGLIGFGLIVAFFAFLLWLLIDYNLLKLNNTSSLIWIGDIISSVILAIGMSWSHIRKRMSGQLDTDNVDE